MNAEDFVRMQEEIISNPDLLARIVFAQVRISSTVSSVQTAIMMKIASKEEDMFGDSEKEIIIKTMTDAKKAMDSIELSDIHSMIAMG